MGKSHALKLTVHPSAILWLCLLFYRKAAILLPFLSAAAVHELGHALVMYLTGGKKKKSVPTTISVSGRAYSLGRVELRVNSAGNMTETELKNQK